MAIAKLSIGEVNSGPFNAIDSVIGRLNAGAAGGGLGTAAFTDASSYATAAQGALADSAVQPGDLSAVATSGEVAGNVTVIADPSTATAEDVANKVNAVITSLVTAGLMEAP